MFPLVENVLEFQDVSCEVNHRTLLSHLNLTIHKSEAVILLGRSGSGKTTTLKLINRLLLPTQGRILVNNRPTTEWNPIKLRRQIGYVIQEVGLFPHFTVGENIALIPTLEQWQTQKIHRRTAEMLNLMGLEPTKFIHRYPHQLSGGQRQRVGVARALAADPPILLMDEPFGALDPITRLELQQQLHYLQTELDKTIVFVTHDIQEAFFLGSRIGLMYEGSLVVLGTKEQVMASEHPEAKAFIACLNPSISANN